MKESELFQWEVVSTTPPAIPLWIVYLCWNKYYISPVITLAEIKIRWKDDGKYTSDIEPMYIHPHNQSIDIHHFYPYVEFLSYSYKNMTIKEIREDESIQGQLTDIFGTDGLDKEQKEWEEGNYLRSNLYELHGILWNK